MGLIHGELGSGRGRAIRAWLLPVVLAGIAAGIALLGDSGREWLSYNRQAIGSGEIWRLVTGHFAHLSVSHFALNVAGLMLVWYLVSGYLGMAQWLVVIAAVIAGIDLGFWLLEPQLIGYVGLSGLLHGLLAAGILAGWPSGRAELRLLGIVLIAKIAYEQLSGPLPGSEATTGGAVIVAAHAYGVLAGILAGTWTLIRVRERPSI